jgi:chemotaxis protein CheY-P-specific phosphatase CheC
MDLRQLEQDIAKEVMHIALAKGADTLSFFVKEKVLLKSVDLFMGTTTNSASSPKSSAGQNYVLSTEVKGAIGGKAYLLFDAHEVECLAAIQLGPSPNAEVAEAFILEIANILTAAVITQFSNILQCAMHGHVPRLDMTTGEATASFIAAGHPPELNALRFTALFHTEKLQIRPEFIWFMEEKFFNAVRGIVTDNKKMEMLKALAAAR